MDVTNEKDRERLFRSIGHFWKTLAPFREVRAKLIQDYVGAYYNKSTAQRHRTIVNLMLQTAEAYTIAIAANVPKFLIAARQKENMPFAHRYKLALNSLVKEIHLDKTLQDCALDAFFGIGIVKIYMADAPLVEIEADVWMDPGEPFADRISQDNWFHDSYATDLRKCQCMGDWYRIPFQALKDGRFDRKVVKKLKPTSKQNQNDERRAAAISSSNETDRDEYQPMIDLIDVWIPGEGLVVTWALTQTGESLDIHNTNPLSVQEWEGAETGPYRHLGLGDVPDNILPTSPASNLKHLSDLTNSLIRKQDAQSRRQKDITLFDGNAEQDAPRVKSAKDGGYVLVNNPQGIQTLKMGGVDKGNLAFSMSTMDLFDRMSGNLKMMAGLGPQSATASQDKMIAQQVGKREGAMREKMNRFATNIGQDLAHLLFQDKVKVIQNTQEVAGYAVDATWTPERRDGEFSDFDFSVEPYSMAYQSPLQRSQVLREQLQELMPIMQLLQGQGIEFDARRYLEIQSELLDIPRLLEVFRFTGSVQAPGNEDSKQSPRTLRENVRTNLRGGNTPEAQRQDMMAQLLSGSDEPQENGQSQGGY